MDTIGKTRLELVSLINEVVSGHKHNSPKMQVVSVVPNAHPAASHLFAIQEWTGDCTTDAFEKIEHLVTKMGHSYHLID